ncbi:MAG: NAD-dependent epimerase/dehydratase family protein, partial [Actinomycetota bacterium]
MRALVTGAAGFIGSHLCERLLRDGSNVVGIDSFTDYYDRSLKEENLAAVRSHPDFELRDDDLLTADLNRLVERVDVVFHLAAQPGVRGSWGRQFDVYVRNNVLATQRLLESMAGRSSAIRFVYASSSSVYGAAPTLPTSEDAPTKPISPYGVSKLAGEHLVSLYGLNRGLPVAIVRYFTVYGPRQRPDMAFTRFIRAALSGDAAELLGEGEQSRDLTFVGDAVDATVRSAEST